MLHKLIKVDKIKKMDQPQPINLFSAVIDQTFSSLDPEIKEDIRKKVLGHMLLRLEEESFQNDSEGVKKLHDKMNVLDDPEKSKLYGEMIGEKFSKLTNAERKTILEKLNTELIEIMNKIYKASL